jgi:nicotinate-nucleotide--dimethylbenzimidazole phosphoribosyltransferase
MTLQEAIENKINNKTKPVGSLGLLEKIALQIGTIQNSTSPIINKPHIVVFAGDHGIAAQGKVNPYPQAVTAQMVLNFVAGGAAINIFCKTNNIDLTVVDAGVNFKFDESLPIQHCKINYGTKDYTLQKAMTEAEAKSAILEGKKIVINIAALGCNTIGFGEMGIGNTSSAALLMHHYTQLPLHDCVGRGTGATNELLEQKINWLQQASTKHELTKPQAAKQLLSKIGGFEIAMMAGAYLEAAKRNMVILVDGFIATAALMAAMDLQSNNNGNISAAIHNEQSILQSCIFCHTSGEKGHEKMLAFLAATPLLNLGLRLGEGTGAALALPLINNAVNFLNQMASFETAGVDNIA